MREALLLLIVVACSPARRETQTADLGSLRYEVPADWNHADTTYSDSTMIVWTPRDNGRKESLTIVRTERNPAMANATSADLERLLATAQRSLPQVRTGNVSPLTTSHGLSGARVDADFQPTGLDVRYRRLHAVVVAGTAVVHVFYTAANPDSDVFESVLSSLRREEG